MPIYADESCLDSNDLEAAAARYQGINIKLDKKDYNPGDRAKALILCSEPGATALLTVQADKIYKTQLLKLNEKLTTVELPVLPAYAPNVFVDVCYIKDKAFESKHKRLLVDLGKKTL